MNGYSKMMFKGSAGTPNVDSPKHWRSLSYRFSSPQSQPSTTPNPITDNTTTSLVPRFGSILSRTCSSVSRRYRSSSDIGNNNQGGSGSGGDLQGTLWRTFSLKRYSSVADAYWRIHDVTCDDDSNGREGKSSGKKRRRNKLINACKRILGIKPTPP